MGSSEIAREERFYGGREVSDAQAARAFLDKAGSKSALNAHDILRALEGRHAPRPNRLREWVFFREFTIGNQWSRDTQHPDEASTARRIDALAINLFRSSSPSSAGGISRRFGREVA